MFHVRVGHESAVYTGDYNMTPDRHLGSAWIDRVRPDVLITESTQVIAISFYDCHHFPCMLIHGIHRSCISYATTLRDSRKARERDFLKKVHDCVNDGGKVLIPVFALGRAQELCILIENYWERMNLSVPVYFSAGLTEKANHFYRLFMNWTNDKLKSTFSTLDRNLFDFHHIKPFDRSYADLPGPMVLFASPGMLHSGTSLEVFKKWAPDAKNMVVIPGYCVPGTIGAKILAGAKSIELDSTTTLSVQLQVKNLSFSAHADAKGIMSLIKQCAPRSVMLVHGEQSKMAILKANISQEFGIPCYDPPNGASVLIESKKDIPIEISSLLFERLLRQCEPSLPLPPLLPDSLLSSSSPFPMLPLAPLSNDQAFSNALQQCKYSLNSCHAMPCHVMSCWLTLNCLFSIRQGCCLW